MQVLREGEGVSTRPTGQAQVRMKVRGSLSSGGVVERHGALEFTVGDGDVIQGLSRIVLHISCMVHYCTSGKFD